MDPAPSHPSDRRLRAFQLGRLDDAEARSVRDHLFECAECRKRVSALTGASTVAGPSSETTGGLSQFAAPAPESLPPGLADHPDYEVKKELGRGGMGVVYLARNTLLDRDEVLKVMGRHVMERPGVLERFQREIRAVAKLRHANIVAAYNAFRLHGALVFTMEYVEGLDLNRLVKAKGPLPVAHAAFFIHQAALGLQHAHEEGTVHRDVKPHNLMLTHRGKSRVVKVLDFGLAKASREEKVDGALTSQGQALGTPDYIAPEQILDATSVDIRADLYSLGGTLYYLLAGRAPFKANSLYDIYQAHISRDADLLNFVRPEVPADLAALVAKLMAKDPERRFQTPGDVADALTPFFKPGGGRATAGSSSFDTSTLGAASPAKSRTTAEPDAPAPARAEARPAPGRPPVRNVSPSIDTTEPPAQAEVPRAPLPPWVPIAAGLTAAALSIAVIVSLRNGGSGPVTAPPTAPGSAPKAPDAPPTIALAEPTPPTPATPAPADRSRTDVPAVASPDVTKPLRPATDYEWQTLFNGRDLSGWVEDQRNGGTWTVEDGALVGRAPADRPGLCYLLTARDYDDFLLRFEFRLPSPVNSGVVLRATPGEKVYPMEVSLRNFPDHRDPPGALGWALGKPGGSFTNPDRLPVMNPNNEWNRMEIEARGDLINISVNGRLTTSYDLRLFAAQPTANPVLRRPSGRIGLQTVAGAASFRYVEIRRLPPGPTPGPPVAPADPPASAFVSLFNGKDLTGWKTHQKQPGNWRVEGNVLVGSGSPVSHLYSTRGDYTDVHVRARARVNDKGIGGVYVRSSFGPKHPPDTLKYCLGYEVPINANATSALLTGSLYGPAGQMSILVAQSPIRPGQWFTLEVIMRGGRVQAKVDGVVTTDFEAPANITPKSGHITLIQNRPESVIEFSRIEVAELNKLGTGSPAPRR